MMQTEPESFGTQSQHPPVEVVPDKDPEGKPQGYEDYTPDKHQLFVNALMAGNYIETAAGLIGVHRNTISRWMEWGEQGKQPFEKFMRDVQQALAASEMNDLRVIDQAAQRDPKWAAWRLERRHRSRWAPKQEKVTVGDPDQPIRIALEWGPKPEQVDNEAQRGIESGIVEDAEVLPPDET